MDQYLIYDEENDTWNLYVNGEWYAQGSYEYCSEMMCNNAFYQYEE